MEDSQGYHAAKHRQPRVISHQQQLLEESYGVARNKPAGCDSGRDRKKKHSPQASKMFIEVGYKGLTLEDYIRGRSSSQKLKTEQTPVAADVSIKARSSIVKLKEHHVRLCFDPNYEIEEEDEENYTQSKQIKERRMQLPSIQQSNIVGRKHTRQQIMHTQKGEDRGASLGNRQRVRTISNYEIFLPVHTNPHRLNIRRNYLRQERSTSKNHNYNNSTDDRKDESFDSQKKRKNSYRLAPHMKLNTTTDFYKPDKQRDLQETPIKVELVYATKYGQKFFNEPTKDHRERKRLSPPV